jgi:exodeoxyribonuclease VII small subunit
MAKKPLKFEQALSRLEEIVTAIEQGEIGLEESIERFEEGMELIRHCRGVLAEAEMKIQKLQADAGGQLLPEPFVAPSEASDSATSGDTSEDAETD